MAAEYIPLATRWIRLLCKCGQNIEFSTRWRQADRMRELFVQAHSGRGHAVAESVTDEGMHE